MWPPKAYVICQSSFMYGKQMCCSGNNKSRLKAIGSVKDTQKTESMFCVSVILSAGHNHWSFWDVGGGLVMFVRRGHRFIKIV